MEVGEYVDRDVAPQKEAAKVEHERNTADERQNALPVAHLRLHDEFGVLDIDLFVPLISI